jgi:hypothetical protein
MRIFAYFLMICSLLMGVLIDMKYLCVGLPVFISFVLFLIGIYILIIKDKKSN